jgi:hypothetical protein
MPAKMTHPCHRNSPDARENAAALRVRHRQARREETMPLLLSDFAFISCK